MSLTDEISHPGSWLQDLQGLRESKNMAKQLLAETWAAGANVVGAVEANPVKSLLTGAAVGAAIVFRKPILAEVGALGERISGGAEKAEQAFARMQEAAGLTDGNTKLQPGHNLIRIRSAGKLREYEAYVPPGLKDASETGEKVRHPVAMAFDTVLFGGRKGPIPYANISEAGLPPNGMPGNGFIRASDESGTIGVFPVPQRQGIFSGWSRILKFVDDGKDVQFVQDMLADLPKRASVELAPVQTAESVPLASVHVGGMSGGGSFVRTLISEGVMPEGTIKSALINAGARLPFHGPVQPGIDTMIVHGQPKNIDRLRQLAAQGVDGLSKLLLDSFPAKLGRGDTVLPYEGGPGWETKVARILGKHNSLAESKPYLFFDDVARANGIDSAAVVPDTSNPFYIVRSARAANGTRVEEHLLTAPFDGHNFAGRPVTTASGETVRSGYRISDLHGPVAPPSVFSTIDRWLEFSGLKATPPAS